VLIMSEEKFDKRFHYVFFNFTGTIINAVLKFLTIIIIVRLLTVADFGVFNILLSILSVVSLIGSLGLEPIMERFIPEYHEKKNYSAHYRGSHDIITPLLRSLIA